MFAPNAPVILKWDGRPIPLGFSYFRCLFKKMAATTNHTNIQPTSTLMLLTVVFTEGENNMRLLKSLLFIQALSEVFSSHLSFPNAIIH